MISKEEIKEVRAECQYIIKELQEITKLLNSTNYNRGAAKKAMQFIVGKPLFSLSCQSLEFCIFVRHYLRKIRLGRGRANRLSEFLDCRLDSDDGTVRC